MNNSKKLFIQALIEVDSKEIFKFENEDEIEWAFSEKFERSMDKLIKKNNRIQLSTRRTVTKSLLVAIISIMILFTGLMSVSAVRKPIVDFVKKVFSQYNEITLNENLTPTVDRIETEYTLTNLPEDFEYYTYQKDEYSVFSVWRNTAGEEIAFSQSLLDSSFAIDNEHGYRELEINGFTAYLTEDEYGSLLRWSDGCYCFIISVPASVKNDIILLQESVSEKI